MRLRLAFISIGSVVIGCRYGLGYPYFLVGTTDLLNGPGWVLAPVANGLEDASVVTIAYVGDFANERRGGESAGDDWQVKSASGEN